MNIGCIYLFCYFSFKPILLSQVAAIRYAYMYLSHLICHINLFVYLFLAVLGLRCCARAFSNCGERGLLSVAVRGLLIAVASHCGARVLGARASVIVAQGSRAQGSRGAGFSSCGSRALERRLSSCDARA